MKKTLSILLLAFSILTNVNAQPSTPDPKTELLNLLKSKHNYERILNYRKENAPVYKTRYAESFAGIKKNESNILSYIDHVSKVDSTVLSKKFVDYNYVSPLSSFHDLKNTITMLAYFKVVKYSLENSKDILPPLSEISFK